MEGFIFYKKKLPNSAFLNSKVDFELYFRAVFRLEGANT